MDRSHRQQVSQRKIPHESRTGGTETTKSRNTLIQLGIVGGTVGAIALASLGSIITKPRESSGKFESTIVCAANTKPTAKIIDNGGVVIACEERDIKQSQVLQYANSTQNSNNVTVDYTYESSWFDKFLNQMTLTGGNNSSQITDIHQKDGSQLIVATPNSGSGVHITGYSIG